MPFDPKFSITSKTAHALMRIEGAKQAINHLPITSSLLATLRESARLYSTHYSTMIEGNRLTQEEVSKVIEKVKARAQEAANSGAPDYSPLLRRLDPRQRQAMALFRDRDTLTSRDMEKLFGISQRTARNLLSGWTEAGFLVVADPAKKSRKYGLANELRALMR